MPNKQQTKGTVNKAKGEVKEAVGRATGSEKLQAEGKADRAKGHFEKKVGDAREGVEKTTKRAADKLT